MLFRSRALLMSGTLSFVLSFSFFLCESLRRRYLYILCLASVELYNEEVNMSLLARYFEDAYAAWITSTAGCCMRTEEENEKAQSSKGESSAKDEDSRGGASSALRSKVVRSGAKRHRFGCSIVSKPSSGVWARSF